MRQSIEQRRRHLGVAEHARPFAEGEIGGDDHRGALIQPADHMEEKLAAGRREGQIAEFIENDKVHSREIVRDASLPAGARFRFEPVDEIDRVEEAPAQACAGASWSLLYSPLRTVHPRVCGEAKELRSRRVVLRRRLIALCPHSHVISTAHMFASVIAGFP